MSWYLERKVGTVLGHEVVGWAEEVGPEVSHLQKGDLVFLHHHAPCGVCADCLRGADVHCSTWRRSHLDPGGMAEWIRIPRENVHADTFAVNDLTVEQATFIEPLGCSIKAYDRMKGLVTLAGSRGAVVGCGVMGLLNLAVGQALGVAELVAVEPDPTRREWAHRFGASQSFTPGQAQQELHQAMDFVIVGPGHPEVIQQSLGYLRNAGVASLFTPTATGVHTSLNLGDLYFREISLIPSYSCGPRDTRCAYQLLRSGKVSPEHMITHRFPLEEIQQAYETARSGKGTLKVLVTF